MRTRGVASDLPLEMSIYYSTLGLATTVESTRGKHLRDSGPVWFALTQVA